MVLDIQREAYDSNSSISSLLRKAYVVSRKLKIKEFEEWINSELNGYKCDYEDIPNYRYVVGNTRGYNPYHGWIPVIIDDTEIAQILNNRRIPDPITSLEVLVKSGGNSLTINYPNGMRRSIAEIVNFNTDFRMFISKSHVEAIIEAVRNIVLEWSLRLEEDGIMGEDMKFTENEKNAAQGKNYTVNNFYGNVSNSQIQQHSDGSNQHLLNENFNTEDVINLVKLVKDNLDQIKWQGKEKEEEVVSQINTIEAQLQSHNPIPSIIIQSFKTIRNILEGVSGSIIASGLIHHLGLFIG